MSEEIKTVEDEIEKNRKTGKIKYIPEPTKPAKKESLLKTFLTWPFRLMKAILGIDGITHEVNKPVNTNYSYPQGNSQPSLADRVRILKYTQDYVDYVKGSSDDCCNHHDHDHDDHEYY